MRLWPRGGTMHARFGDEEAAPQMSAGPDGAQHRPCDDVARHNVRLVMKYVQISRSSRNNAWHSSTSLTRKAWSSSAWQAHCAGDPIRPSVRRPDRQPATQGQGAGQHLCHWPWLERECSTLTPTLRANPPGTKLVVCFRHRAVGTGQARPTRPSEHCPGSAGSS